MLSYNDPEILKDFSRNIFREPSAVTRDERKSPLKHFLARIHLPGTMYRPTEVCHKRKKFTMVQPERRADRSGERRGERGEVRLRAHADVGEAVL